MRLEAACFTRRGEELGKKLAAGLAAARVELRLTRCGGEGPPVQGWAARHFATAGALLFIGAAGIAVRAIAPHVASKTSDPAVLVLGEDGRHVIPLLSGHIGGANALARQVASALGAQAVVTTATDINGVFAVDDWAREQGWHIQNPERIKEVSARLLAGEGARLYSMFPVAGALPPGLALAEGEADADVAVTVYSGGPGPGPLRLTPPALVLGVGCRWGTGAPALEAAFAALCAKERLHPAAFCLACSIHLKKDEPGLKALCEGRGWPLSTFSAEALASAPGAYTGSAFVEETTGVDNVCERSAVLGSGGTLLVKKTAASGIALAVAMGSRRVQF